MELLIEELGGSVIMLLLGSGAVGVLVYPDILWSSHGRIQLNEEVTVILTMDTNIGLFGEFASFPVTLRAQAAGKSEVYWK